MLAIIGGSGLYQLDGLVVTEQHGVTTPFGLPSGPITQGQYQDQQVLFSRDMAKDINSCPMR